jgi:ABC-type antimicrobial peptide transport system permease subunit
VDSEASIPAIRSLGGIVADSVAARRFEMDLLLVFAISALLLAGMGVYGVITYSVVQRHREIGLRIALCAQRTKIYSLVLSEGLAPVTAGMVAGIGLTFGLTRMMRSLLFEVSPYNPLLVCFAASTLLEVGIAACLLPARRAADVEPIQALRSE